MCFPPGSAASAASPLHTSIRQIVAQSSQDESVGGCMRKPYPTDLSDADGSRDAEFHLRSGRVTTAPNARNSCRGGDSSRVPATGSRVLGHRLVTSVSPDDRVGYSSHSVTNRSLACMSTCLSLPVPEFTNLCGTPAGTTTTWPPSTSVVSSPDVKVALPSCTTKTSS